MSSSPISLVPYTARSIVVAALTATLSFAALPLFAQSGEATNGTSAATSAQDFVPAQAVLINTLDSKKLQPGASFEAQLDGKVKFAGGMELPAGTLLRGTVASDDQNVQGNAKLALRFETAQLKNGQTVPVRATIVGFEAPGNQEMAAYSGYETPQPNDWNPATVAVDQIGVTSGVDLHSKVGSANSGVFVATKKDDVKLSKGSAVNLAIEAGPAAQQQSGE